MGLQYPLRDGTGRIQKMTGVLSPILFPGTDTYVISPDSSLLTAVSGQITRNCQYDAAGHLIAESDETGAMTRFYVWLSPRSHETMKGHEKRPGRRPVFLPDHPGTPGKLIDTSGNVVWEAAYLQLLDSSGQTPCHSFPDLV